MIKCGMQEAALDYAILSDCGVVAASFFDRSLMLVRSVAGSMNTEGVQIGGKPYLCNKAGYDTFINPVVYGKEKYYHAFSITKSINDSVFITTADRAPMDYYNLLMSKFDLPLLKEWKDALFEYSISEYTLRTGFSNHVKLGTNHEGSTIEFMGKEIPSSELAIYDVSISEGQLKEMVSTLLKEGRIKIAELPQKKLEFKTMDDYFKNYGHTLVSNLEKQIKPLTELNGNTESLVLNTMRLYPQQVAQVNGIKELFKHSKYGILNMGMGTGKTICSSSMVEGYFVDKYLAAHPKETLRDVYSDDTRINYRNIVMCPGHLVKKWAAELRREIPYAKVSIVNDLAQLIELREHGIQRNGKEWYIIGKDFAKLSYQSIPVPNKVAHKRIKIRVCNECNTPSYDTRGGKFKCKCGCTEYHIFSTSQIRKGLVCPDCGEVLMPNGTIHLNNNEDDSRPLMPWDFTNPTSRNQKCHLCGSELWQPYIRNINMPGEFHEMASRHSKWHRSTHYANKTHKARKTVWVHRDYEETYYAMIGERPLSEKSDQDKGVRKYAPAAYIRKHLKGFFDVFILDEAHLFKGGATAQGNAMQALVSASRHQLALTGTIAGGMATHLFYLLYRLDPQRMKNMGFAFTDEMAFARKYGTVETEYQSGDDDDSESKYNQSSKGRQLGSPKAKPGISPLIFSDFLLDKTVFLDLSDMSKFLPPLKEKVVRVNVPEMIEDETGCHRNLEWDCMMSYKGVIRKLKEIARSEEGRGVLSMMLQFSLSYLDHPYGVPDILSPSTGEILVEPDDYTCLVSDGKLLAKERELVNIISKELSEGRNCVVYAEFTGSAETCVTHRLKEIIERECGLKEHEVTILEASSPAAAKREEWMHEKAKKGTRVFITNPRCVETGLDFCWSADGIIYNYPTLIFYQMGYSLFTIWQASRRSFRLNQREECHTYYMAYEGTVQEAVISLIAEKQVATSAIQGKFSTEGLSAMAQGVDVKLKLAQAMSDMDSINGNGLQDMFDVLNQDNTDMSAYSDYVPMKTFAELMGDDYVVSKDTENVFDVFDSMTDTFNFDAFLDVFKAENQESSGISMDDVMPQVADGENAPVVKETRRTKKLAAMGQMSLF